LTADFTVLELGFGDGLNFLRHWEDWRQRAQPKGRLHWVALTPRVLPREALAAAHTSQCSSPEWLDLSTRLLRVWPGHLHGVHRLMLDDTDVSLTLAMGEVGGLIGQLRLSADVVHIDADSVGDANAWDVRTLKHCARLSRAGAKLLARVQGEAQTTGLRAALLAAGYVVEDAPSSDATSGRDQDQKPEQAGGITVLTARKRWRPQGGSRPAQSAASQDKHAIVIGAGIAGAAVSDRLAARGWRITLLEREAEPARGASGLWLGAMHPHFSEDDCLLSRTSRAAMQLAVQRFNEIRSRQPGCGWLPCGVAHPATSVDEEQALRSLCERLQLPAHVVTFLERDALSRQAGVQLPHGGYWHAHTGVVDVRRLVQQLISQPGIELRASSPVQGVARVAGGWQALGCGGQVLAQAPVMVVANAGQANQLLPQLETMHPVRGQMSGLREWCITAPQAAVVGFGYVLPAVDGRISLGATYDPGSTSMQVKQSDHALNLQSLTMLLPHSPPLPADVVLESFVGVRYAARDHLPLIGPVPDVSNQTWLANAAGKRLTDLPRHEGLYCAVGYGSRGLSWSVLAGEIVASHLMDEPAPLDSALMGALDPARFVLRDLRRNPSGD
jgi:tRNA 5-methylaminomethyl-2-thiouridine biosynthesis bifunctional protein